MQSILERLEKKEQDTIKSTSKIAFHVITNKKKSPRLIDLQSVLSRETPIENSMINLSIDDYERICKNEDIRYKQAMSRALKITVSKLTEICKNTESFKNYIESLPNTKKEKERAIKTPIKDLPRELLSGLSAKTLKLFHLPEHIIEHITEESLVSLHKFKYKIVEYKLVDGIPQDKLNQPVLSKNKNAIYYLVNSGRPIDYYWLSGNTSANAMGLLAEEMNINPDVRINWSELSKNPEAFNILKANRAKIEWGHLSLNTNPKAMRLLEEEIKVNPTHIKFESLAANETPEAMKLIKDNLLIENSIYTTNWNRFLEILSRNKKAIKILEANRGKIDWCSLCGNQSTEAIKLLEEEMKAEPDIINWIILSGNSNEKAFAILEANPTKINIRRLSGNTNPKAIELLKKRMEYENNLSEAAYDGLRTSDKIDWNIVSSNPSAIELLKERIIYERNLPEHRYRRLKDAEKIINWSDLSVNPSIFTI